jgi:hypothetical protein
MRIIVFLGIALVCLAGLALGGHVISGGGEQIGRDVMAGGGGRSTNPAGLVLEGSLFQSVAAVSRSSNGTVVVGGFQTMTPSPPSTAVRYWNLY